MVNSLKSPITLVIILAALVMAFISAHYLFNGSVVNTVPWGILAFATAFVAKTKKESLRLGGVFGFVVSYSFLWFDDKSITASKIAVLIPLIVLPALFGMFCGVLAAWGGWKTRELIIKS